MQRAILLVFAPECVLGAERELARHD